MTRSHFYGLVVFLVLLPLLPLQGCEGPTGLESLTPLAGSTDPVDKASREGVSVIDKDLQAQNLSDSGIKNGKIADIDKAIAIFPQRAEYRTDKAALLLSQGDINGSNRALAEAKGLAGEDFGELDYVVSLKRVRNTLPPGSEARNRVIGPLCEILERTQPDTPHSDLGCP
jgi:hypothetical protein